MRQILTITALLAMACAGSGHAEESDKTPTPSLKLGPVSLTPFGQFDQFLGQSRSNGNNASPGAAPGQGSQVTLLNGGLSTSNIGLKGAAPIAGKTEGIFELSAFVDPESGSFGRSGGQPVTIAGATFGKDPVFSRAANLGLHNSDWGSVKFGTDITPLFFSAIKSNAFGDSVMFGPLPAVMFINSGLSGGTNWQKGVFYDSAAFHGVTVRLAYSFGDSGSLYVSPAAANNSPGQAGHNVGASVNYAAGALAGNLSYQKVNRNGVIGNFSTSGLSVDNTSTWLAGLSYDFGLAKLSAHLGDIRDDSSASSPFYAAEQKVYEISASVPFGSGDFLLGVARRSANGNVAATPDVAIQTEGAPGGAAGRTLATAGYNYHLFKNTDLYALFASDSTRTKVLNTSNGSVAIGSAKAFDVAFGARFSF